MAEYSRFEKRILSRLMAGNAIMNIFPLRFLFTLFFCSCTLSFYFLLAFGFSLNNKWIMMALTVMLIVDLFIYARHEYIGLGFIVKQAKKLSGHDK